MVWESRALMFTASKFIMVSASRLAALMGIEFSSRLTASSTLGGLPWDEWKDASGHWTKYMLNSDDDSNGSVKASPASLSKPDV